METNEKSQRLIEAASAILHAAPNRCLNAVVLNKVLFYLDLAALRDRGQTVTQNPYIALQNGPVIAKYPQRLIAPLSPLKATPKGGKVLKVRWALPGCGKSGSLHLVVVAYCDERRVHIAQAFKRRDNPTDDDVRVALDDM